jgi:hypothetical protein
MRPDLVRWFLGAALLLVAVNAFAGGYYGLAGAPDVPTEWLEGSPFETYLVPSLILFVVVGGAFLLAAIGVFADTRWAHRATVAAVAIAIGWLTTQVAIIGYVSWMQPATAIATAVIAGLAWRLHVRRSVARLAERR